MGDGDDNPKVMPIKRRLLAKVMHLYQTAWYQPGRFEGPAEAGGHEGTQMWKLRFLKPPQSSRDPLQSKLPCRDDAQHLEQVESRELPAAWRRGLEVLLADGKRVHVHVEIGPRTESIANAWNPLRCCVKTNCHGKDQDFAQYNEKSNRYHQAKSPFASIFTVLITTLVVEDAKVEEAVAESRILPAWGGGGNLRHFSGTNGTLPEVRLLRGQVYAEMVWWRRSISKRPRLQRTAQPPPRTKAVWTHQSAAPR